MNESRLISPKFDLDPDRWKPMFYETIIEVPVLEDSVAEESIELNNMPFILVRIAHTILGNTGDPETSGLYNDGQYLIEFSDEKRNYGKWRAHANLLCGPLGVGSYRELEYPIFYPGTHAIRFRLTNTYTRTLSPKEDNFRVQLLLAGVEDSGRVQGGSQ